MAFLKVYSNDEERTVFLADAPVVLGRGQDTDCMIADHKASRHHCVFEPVGGGHWRVRDLGSGNGTRVNGARIGQPHLLKADDVVQLGDAKVVFAGEAAAVVEPVAARGAASSEPADAPREEAPGRMRRSDRPVQRTGATGWIIGGVVIVLGVALLAFWPRSDGTPRDDPAELTAWHAVASAEGDLVVIDRAERYLVAHPTGEHAAQVGKLLAAAKERRDGGSARAQLPEGLDAMPARDAVARLEELRATCDPAMRPAVEGEMDRQRERLQRENETFFASLRDTFRGLVADGHYAQAREIWFFLRGDERWCDDFVRPIRTALEELEIAASADRSRLFHEVDKLEGEQKTAQAIDLLAEQRPRFAGTAVARSLDEKIAYLRKARASGKPTRRVPEAVPTVERPALAATLAPVLARLGQRDWTGVADALRAFAEKATSAEERDLLAARVREVEAAAALQRAMVGDLQAGKLPPGQIERRWRVLQGGPDGIKVRERGEETDYTWDQVPAELLYAMLGREVEATPDGALGLVVVAQALGDKGKLAEALASGYLDEKHRPLLDRFVADRVREEPLPDGGYVVHAGEVLSRREYTERAERERIQTLQADLENTLKAIRESRVFQKLAVLTEKKNKLDEVRQYALALIFDEQKYFYPYRGSPREGEYWPVQKEVDARVAGVREVWEDRATIGLKADATLERQLAHFDEVAAELKGKAVDVEDAVADVDFLRSYLGKKFTVQDFYRTPDEQELLRYSVEVMEDNAQVKGDITEIEREQVRVTNLYRMMFGRWPCRIVEPLVLSSRGHCQEMSRLGYFGHFSPTPGRRTPYDRMRLAGYQFGASENCVMGQSTPQGAHDAWCHSSGHHRNLLMPEWTEMGTGHDGRYMTQNFGRAPRHSGAWSADTPGEGGEAQGLPRGRDEDDGGDGAHDDGFQYGD